MPRTGTSLAAACRAVLTTAEPSAKVKAARAAARAWRRGELDFAFDVAMPAQPGRPARPELLPPNRMPKRGRAGSPRSRIALLHALAHIECVAIDLAFDLIGRFGAAFPPDFTDDWIGVGADEAMHFALLDRRLRALGSHYGALPAHAGLWQAAEATAHNPLARLAVVPMVLEARARRHPGDGRLVRGGGRRALGDDSVAHLPRRNSPRRGGAALVRIWLRKGGNRPDSPLATPCAEAFSRRR